MHPTTGEGNTEETVAAGEEQFVARVFEQLRRKAAALYRTLHAGDGALGTIEETSRQFGVDTGHDVMEVYW